ncbi:MAG TPA: arginine deiminase-related protein [Bacteriovoracaceae bacterium]|nr:arginine deiminase-related protein [Bacteriovoracaceae bacterium]
MVFPSPKRVLMARPTHFDVLYDINPYMKNEAGELQKVDKPRAMKQWQELHDKYLSLGFEVEVIEGTDKLPDIVFTANQSLPFWDVRNNCKAVLMSQMRSEFRKEEVEIFSRWYEERGYKVYRLSDASRGLEGNGDALIHPGKRIIWGGTGPRTDREVYGEVGEITQLEVMLLPLINPMFYHLDTCFSILNGETVVIQPDAFSKESRDLIKKHFKNVIETTKTECMAFFTANCHSPNGKDVIYQSGATSFESSLRSLGFNLHPVETSEFMKSGGSVFCMKMMVF